MIPITKPFLGRAEYRAVREVICSGWVAQGPKVKEFEESFARYTGARFACAVSSGTAALHLALLAVGVEPEDVVITVSHSFIATANSIRFCQAVPVFMDIDPETYNISYEKLERCLTDECIIKGGKLFHNKRRVGAILPVHQMGMPCDMQKIFKLASRYDVPIVEDAACAIGSDISMDGGKTWEKIGAPHGKVACFSLHPRKVITTGEGGMIVTSDREVKRKVKILRNQGMESSPRRGRRGAVSSEKYAVVGYNYRMTDIQAAIGIEQVKRLDGIVSSRRKIAALYSLRLKKIPWLRLTEEPSYARTNWQSYPVRVLDTAPVTRDELIAKLEKNGIYCWMGIMNAHQEPAYRSGIVLKNSEEARDEVILLPLYPEMRPSDVEKVAGVIANG